MKDTIWIIKSGAETPIYQVFEGEAEAEECFEEIDEACEIVKYNAVHIYDCDWKKMYEDEEQKYEKLSVELDGLRTALAVAKAESEKRINVAMEELRVARSDVHTLEEVIVKMAMRLVGM